MKVNRLVKPIKSKSFFLFGARGVGKTTFLKAHFENVEILHFDLLDPEKEDLYSTKPEVFRQEILFAQGNFEWVVVDEIQKCPKLLNVIHKLIVEKKFKFALTGSSARRLKQRGTNLLAGRALSESLFPFVYFEIKETFDLLEVMHFGALPEVYLETDKETKKKFLRSYVLNYVKLEVQTEQWVRNLDPFRKFLQVAAQQNGKIVNYSNISSDVGASVATVQSYFEILEDTYLGFYVSAYHSSIRKQQRMAPKFYFFDLGVKRALEKSLDTLFNSTTSAYGEAFEHFIVVEIYRLLNYWKPDFELHYLLTKDGAEIDLIITRPGQKTILMEIKSKTVVDERDCRHLLHFQSDFEDPLLLLASCDLVPKNINGVQALPWVEALKLVFDI
jgi:uncharacterized protein